MRLALIGLVLAVVGCSSASAPPKVCTPGASVACVGAGGCAGGQVCSPDGLALDVCVCGGGTTGTTIASTSSTGTTTASSGSTTTATSTGTTTSTSTGTTTSGSTSSGGTTSGTTSGGLGCSADAACDAGFGACAGACVEGACVYPTTACADGTQCITDGTCASGLCAGPSACQASSLCTGSAITLLQSPTCLPSASPGIPGTCAFQQGTETCDCGCGPTVDGGCVSSWALDATSPSAVFGSVWSSASGDTWASAQTGTATGEGIGQALYERVNGSWTLQASLPLGSSPVYGAFGIALTGDQSGDIYGANSCAFIDSLGDCGDAGVWKWSNGAASIEPLAPPSFADACGDLGNFATTYPVLLGNTPAFLDSSPCGPDLMTESNGQFTPVGGTQLPIACSASGALWGTSSSDAYIAWACGGAGGGGGIWHYTGNHLSTTPDFPFTSPDNAAAMAGTGDTDIWAVGTQRWHFNGVAWTASTPPPSGAVDLSLWSVGDGTYFVGGQYPGVYHYASAAWTHECMAPGYTANDRPVSQVSGDNAGNFYAATAVGVFKRQ